MAAEIPKVYVARIESAATGQLLAYRRFPGTEQCAQLARQWVGIMTEGKESKWVGSVTVELYPYAPPEE